jgi:hypothetical protein
VIELENLDIYSFRCVISQKILNLLCVLAPVDIEQGLCEVFGLFKVLREKGDKVGK